MKEQASSSTQVNASSELAGSLRKAFAGQEDKLPQGVRDALEKIETENGKALIRSMRNTTNALSKAKKAWAEIVEARKAHRAQWMHYMTESVTQWDNQLQELRKKQAFYQEQATRATAEIAQARKMMDQLGAKAAGEVHQPKEEVEEVQVVEPEMDIEEVKLRYVLTQKLGACAAALGIDVKSLPIILEDDNDMDDAAGSQKRALADGAQITVPAGPTDGDL